MLDFSLSLSLSQIAHIRANVEPNAAVLVSGDFNAGENEPPIATMHAGGFVDTFRVLYPNATDVGTFHGFRGTPGVEKIDYVFASTAASIVRPSVFSAFGGAGKSRGAGTADMLCCGRAFLRLGLARSGNRAR